MRTSVPVAPGDVPATFASRLAHRVTRVALHVFKAALTAWATLAVWFSNLPWTWARAALACAFLGFAVWALWIVRTRTAIVLFAFVFLTVLLWWLSISPSNDRHWRPESAVTPRAFINGDRVRITGVRNFDYRSETDFTPRYEVREFSLQKLQAIDFYISYWMPGPVGHTFVSFIFDDAPPLSISIEARYEIGEHYAPIASMFKQFELIYVVGDERDIVRLRTNYRGEKVYLYRIRASPQDVRQLFQVYLQRINALADHPEFYHLLRNSCTINIVQYTKSIGSGDRFDIRHYLNGLFDGYLYDTGRIDTTIPIEELRRHAYINDVARAADDSVHFSDRIRQSMH